MFKHPKCGGQHETVSQARQCEQGQTATVNVKAETAESETWPWATPTKAERPAQKRFEDRPRTKGDLDKRNGPMPLGLAYAYALKGGAPAPVAEPEFIAPTATVEAPGCTGYPTHPPVRYPASDAQKSFIARLLEERDWGNSIAPESALGEAISDLGHGEEIEKYIASQLITALKDLPKAQDLSAPAPSAPRHSQPWKALAEEVPAGNYCVTDSEGKRHFYRVSVSDKGFYKLQERASEMLHFIPLGRYAGILQTILDEGVEKARLAYSTHMKRCWKCGFKLTDNTGNPYYYQGLGPDCGAQ